MGVVFRGMCFAMTLAVVLAFDLSAAFSQDRISGEVATLTIKFRYKGEMIGTGEFKDRTTIDQTAVMVCPVTAADLSTTSSILPPTEQQERANKQLGDAATKEIEAIPAETVSGLKSLDKQMKDCKASGKSDQMCGMEVMAAMQSNPKIIEQMASMGGADRKGMAAAQQAVADAAGSYQAWYNEGCTGTMSVNNSFQLDDPTIPGPEPILRTTGTQKIDTRDTLVTVETDHNRNETRYMIIPPQASFHRDAYEGEKPTMETLMAIPTVPVQAGPFPGPIQAGRYGKTFNGGSYSVEWTVVRGK